VRRAADREGKYKPPLFPLTSSNPRFQSVLQYYWENAHDWFLQVRKEGPQFHSLWHDTCNVESATVTGNHVKMTFRFPVLYEYCNPAHLLHGAAQAVFYDVCMAYLPLPLRKPGFWEELGFTRNLNVNFLRTAKLGEFVLLDLEVSPALELARELLADRRPRSRKSERICVTCKAR
jgi:hypothetical protein